MSLFIWVFSLSRSLCRSASLSSVCNYVCSSVCLSLGLPACPSVPSSVCRSICLPLCTSFPLSPCFSASLSLSLLSLCLLVCLSVSLTAPPTQVNPRRFLFLLRVFRLGLLRTRGLEEPRLGFVAWWPWHLLFPGLVLQARRVGNHRRFWVL